jgi:hypothetical protein
MCYKHRTMLSFLPPRCEDAKMRRGLDACTCVCPVLTTTRILQTNPQEYFKNWVLKHKRGYANDLKVCSL